MYEKYAETVFGSKVFENWISGKAKGRSHSVRVGNYRQLIIDNYVANGKMLDPTAADLEIIANFTSEMLFNEKGNTLERFINEVNGEDRNVISQFIEMFGIPKDNSHEYPIGTISDVVCDVHYGTSKKASDDGVYTYLRMNNIAYGGELDLTDIKHISIPQNELDGCLVKKGDVLFNRTNSRELVGKTCAFMLDEPMIIAGYIIRLRMNGKVCPEYLSTFLNLDSSKKMLMAMAKGAVGQANINAKEVQAIEIVIPPLEVQQQFCHLVHQNDKSKYVAFQETKFIENLLNYTYNHYFRRKNYVH